MSDRLSNLLKCFLLVTLPYTNDMISISSYTQRTLKLFTPIIKSFVALKVLMQKQENPMVYGANFTQCICTGYCESWMPSLLIMNS